MIIKSASTYRQLPYCSVILAKLPVGLRPFRLYLDLGVDPRSRLKSICTFQVGSDHFCLPSNRICLAPVGFMSSRLSDKNIFISQHHSNIVCTALSLILNVPSSTSPSLSSLSPPLPPAPLKSSG